MVNDLYKTEYSFMLIILFSYKILVFYYVYLNSGSCKIIKIYNSLLLFFEGSSSSILSNLHQKDFHHSM
ncbi:hypothetical protein B1J94_08735 [Leptospira kirschneri serovar Grippotyphosa]|nr:hypothetical protein B1J94_08735 [Leptospira kirschneri serovar Grippotyphosa]